MVRFLVLFLILLFYGDHFLNEYGYGQFGRLFPEAFAGLVMVVVIVQMAIHRRFDLPAKYMLWFMLFIGVIIAGSVANQTNTGAMVMGLRENFKYAPLFLLPIVYQFKPEQMRVLMYWILFFALIQLPFMIYQRITEPLLTGDVIVGTLLFANNVSAFLICVWAVLFAFYIRKRIPLIPFGILSVLVLLPTTLNETKGSLVLLPFAFVMPLLLAPQIKHLWFKLSLGGVAFVGVAVAYSTIGDMLLGPRLEQSMLEFFTNPAALRAYFMPSEMGGSWMGRLDKLFLAWEQITQSTVTTLLGVGLGNVNDTSSSHFQGEFTEYGHLLGTSLIQFLWENGILGLILAFMPPIMSFMDARRVAREDSFAATIANGWGAVCAIMFVSVFYIRAPDVQAVSYMFWFFCGYLAAEKFRLSRAAYTVDSGETLPAGQVRPSLLTPAPGALAPKLAVPNLTRQHRGITR